MRPHVDEPVSPELVLVDPELAARVRPFAVAGPVFEEPRREPARATGIAPAVPLRPPAPPEADPSSTVAHAARTPVAVRGERRRRSVVGRLASAVAMLAFAALLGTAFLPPRDAPRLADTPATANAATSSRVTLMWVADDDASYYLVEMYVGRTLVHAESTRGTKLVTPAWLPAGRYTWRVFSGNGSPPERNTNGPLESGWFVITPA